MSNTLDNNDWRLRTPKDYLLGATLYWRAWRESQPGWDHDHCEFCWAKFTDREDVKDVLREGYTTADEYWWICSACARDFAERFQFTLFGEADNQ